MLIFLTFIRGTYPVQSKIKWKIKGVDLKYFEEKLHCYNIFGVYFWSFTELKMKKKSKEVVMVQWFKWYVLLHAGFDSILLII